VARLVQTAPISECIVRPPLAPAVDPSADFAKPITKSFTLAPAATEITTNLRTHVLAYTISPGAPQLGVGAKTHNQIAAAAPATCYAAVASDPFNCLRFRGLTSTPVHNRSQVHKNSSAERPAVVTPTVEAGRHWGPTPGTLPPALYLRALNAGAAWARSISSSSARTVKRASDNRKPIAWAQTRKRPLYIFAPGAIRLRPAKAPSTAKIPRRWPAPTAAPPPHRSDPPAHLVPSLIGIETLLESCQHRQHPRPLLGLVTPTGFWGHAQRAHFERRRGGRSRDRWSRRPGRATLTPREP